MLAFKTEHDGHTVIFGNNIYYICIVLGSRLEALKGLGRGITTYSCKLREA